jgi:hypothetical protein
LLLPFHPAVAAQLLLPLAGLLLFSVLLPPFGQDLAREVSALLARRQLGLGVKRLNTLITRALISP